MSGYSPPNMSPGFPRMALEAPGCLSSFLLAEEFKCYSPDPSVPAHGHRIPKETDKGLQMRL